MKSFFQEQWDISHATLEPEVAGANKPGSPGPENPAGVGE